MKRILVSLVVLASIYACGNQSGSAPTETTENVTANANPSYDPKRGEGKFKDVQVAAVVDEAKAATGNQVYGVKCGSCHKLTEEKLVGPGWKGVTTRRSAAWILNFITNTDEMLSKDPEAQAQLEICLVRMPNQNLADADAHNLYEFMRKNDASK